MDISKGQWSGYISLLTTFSFVSKHVTFTPSTNSKSYFFSQVNVGAKSAGKSKLSVYAYCRRRPHAYMQPYTYLRNSGPHVKEWAPWGSEGIWQSVYQITDCIPISASL